MKAEVAHCYHSVVTLPQFGFVDIEFWVCTIRKEYQEFYKWFSFVPLILHL